MNLSWIRKNRAAAAIVAVSPFLLVAARLSAFAMYSRPSAHLDLPAAQIDVPSASAPATDPRADALSAYEHGDLDLAVELASNAGLAELSEQIQSVQTHASASAVARLSTTSTRRSPSWRPPPPPTPSSPPTRASSASGCARSSPTSTWPGARTASGGSTATSPAQIFSPRSRSMTATPWPKRS